MNRYLASIFQEKSANSTLTYVNELIYSLSHIQIVRLIHIQLLNTHNDIFQ
ncbi:hypothetical protein VIM7927_00018 [Vibrio mangrovi]|uniref:Uncharacterized protein n=1 Tax=Vibrio mangrovi TaxID=474394 RepID=A0A1Y6IMC4_9VIBR|nr:hypothetical protein VIM7927_00018 [Vibrio mangrovi]